MHEGDSLESAVGRKSKRVKKTFLRKLLRSLGYSFRESRWHLMAHGTYETVFRKFVGNRKVKQLQSLPSCRRGWRMTWRNKKKKGWVCAPQSSGAPSRRGGEIWWPRSHRVTDPGSFRRASEGFLTCPISFITPPTAGKEPEATSGSLPLSFSHLDFQGAGPSVQPKWSQHMGQLSLPGQPNMHASA